MSMENFSTKGQVYLQDERPQSQVNRDELLYNRAAPDPGYSI